MIDAEMQRKYAQGWTERYGPLPALEKGKVYRLSSRETSAGTNKRSERIQGVFLGAYVHFEPRMSSTLETVSFGVMHEGAPHYVDFPGYLIRSKDKANTRVSDTNAAAFRSKKKMPVLVSSGIACAIAPEYDLMVESGMITNPHPDYTRLKIAS